MYTLAMIFSMITAEGVQQDGFRTIQTGLSFSACKVKAESNTLAAGKGMVATLNCVPQ